MKLLIEVRQGLIQSVWSNTRNVDVEIWDFDSQEQAMISDDALNDQIEKHHLTDLLTEED